MINFFLLITASLSTVPYYQNNYPGEINFINLYRIDQIKTTGEYFSYLKFKNHHQRPV